MDFLLSLLPAELLSELGIFLTLLTLVFYFAESFSGYRLIRSWISILGFLFGAIGSHRLGTILFDQSGYAILAAIIGGIFLSTLSYKVYLVGVFLIAAYGAAQVGLLLLPLEGGLLYAAAIFLGLAAGYLAVKYMRPAIIAITAYHGGIMAASQLPFFIALPAGWSTLTCGLVIGTAGLVIQFLTGKK